MCRVDLREFIGVLQMLPEGKWELVRQAESRGTQRLSSELRCESQPRRRSMPGRGLTIGTVRVGPLRLATEELVRVDELWNVVRRRWKAAAEPQRTSLSAIAKRK